jgi:predicted phage terminase large subunit-like protein
MTDRNEVLVEQLADRTAFCDPAGGQTLIKRQRARSAIVVVAQDPLQRIFVLHAWADRVTTDRLYERIFEIQQKFGPRVFGIEANGLQSLFGDGVRREARLSGKRIPLVGVHQTPKLEKTFRNRSCLQPVIAEGRLFIQPHQHELRQELATHPMSPTFDLIDALSSAISLLPKRLAVPEVDDEAANLARYLRRTGAPVWMIERRVEELRRRQKSLAPTG